LIHLYLNGVAKLRGVVRTAKVDPFAWFQDVLSRIGECSIQQLDTKVYNAL
jgi:hypothetical protein